MRVLAFLAVFLALSVFGAANNLFCYFVWGDPFNLLFAVPCVGCSLFFGFFLFVYVWFFVSRRRFARRLRFSLGGGGC